MTCTMKATQHKRKLGGQHKRKLGGQHKRKLGGQHKRKLGGQPKQIQAVTGDEPRARLRGE